MIGAALGLGIEAADRLQRIAEEVEPRRIVNTGWVQIDDAAAHRIFAGFAHRRGADEPVEFEPAHDAVHGQHIAGRRRQPLPGHNGASRHALNHRVDGGKQDRRPRLRPGLLLEVSEARQCRHALGHEAGVGGGAVIGLAIPGREFQHADIWREEAERAGELRHAAAVAANHKQAGRGRFWLSRNRACEIGEHQPLGAIGDARERQRPALL